MYRRAFLFFILPLAIAISAWAEEFYFGAQGNQTHTYDNMTSAELIAMRDTLGFNVYSALAAWPVMLDSMDNYLKLIPNMYSARNTPQSEFNSYEQAHYARVEAEDESYQIRFYNPPGLTRVVENGFAMAPYDPDSSYEQVYLDSLWYKHRDGSEAIYTFGIAVRAVDGNTAPGDTMAYGDTIGFIKVWTGDWWDDLQKTLIETYVIEADTFLNAGSDTLYLEFGPLRRVGSGLDYIQIGTNNACSLGVDFLKIYNVEGWNLVEELLYVDDFVDFAQTNSQYVRNWYLHDEPQFLEWEPFNKIRAALESAGYKSANSAWQVSDDRPTSYLPAKITLIK